MNVHECCYRKPEMQIPILPADTLLDFEDFEVGQTMTAGGEGLTARTARGLAFGCLFAIPITIFGLFLVKQLFARQLEPSVGLYGMGICAMLAFYGYYAAKPSIQAGWGSIELKISNGFLEIQHNGPCAEESSIISLEKVIEVGITPTFVSSTTSSLWVRLPTYDFKPLNSFFKNKDCRHHTLVSYVDFIVLGRRPQDLRCLEKWIAKHVDAARTSAGSDDGRNLASVVRLIEEPPDLRPMISYLLLGTVCIGCSDSAHSAMELS